MHYKPSRERIGKIHASLVRQYHQGEKSATEVTHALIQAYRYLRAKQK